MRTHRLGNRNRNRFSKPQTMIGKFARWSDEMDTDKRTRCVDFFLLIFFFLSSPLSCSYLLLFFFPSFFFLLL